jgi:hypothetical protein
MLIPTLKHLYAFQIIYPLALFFVKTSILALYYRIFSHTAFRWKVYFVAGFVSVYTIIVVFINVGHSLVQFVAVIFTDTCRPLNVDLRHQGHGHMGFRKAASIHE